MAIAIQISERWRITNDDYNVIIQCFRGKGWVNATYHPDLKAACEKMLKNLVFASKAETLEQLVAAEERAAKMIADALTERKKMPKEEMVVMIMPTSSPPRKPKPPSEGEQLDFFGEEMTA